jgi:acetyl-CoA carboxylase carboxyl transferase subunit beta
MAKTKAGQPQATQDKRVPEGLWMRCPDCENMVYRKQVDDGFGLCPDCSYHFRLTARKRIAMLADEGSFEEYLKDIRSNDPLKFTDRKPYADRLAAAQRETGELDAAVVGRCYIRGRPTVLGALNPDFIMGSMGSVVGEKVTHAIEKATEQSLPLVLVSTSGGARMMEGIISLMQMAKTSAALSRLDDAGGLYISVLVNPCTAGVAASFAFLGDVIIAEPHALIGFAGPRVIFQTMKRELPDGFQTSEFLLEHGFIDRIVPRENLRSDIASIIDYCGK